MRDLRNAPDVRLARLAARQHGIVTVNQLRVLGLDKHAVTRRVQRGALHRLGPGVYAVGHTALAREGEFLAQVLIAARDGVLGYEACAELWGVWRWRAAGIDVLVPRQRRVRSDARIHRAKLHPDDVTVHKGVPCTTIARLIVDLAARRTSWEIAAVLHEAEFDDRLDLDAAHAALDRANGRPTKAARKAIRLHLDGSAGVRSKGELRTLIELERRGLPEPRVNTDLNGHEVDFHWPRLKLAIERDGSGHGRAQTRAEDAVKERAWRAAGYELLRYESPYAIARAVDLYVRGSRSRGRGALPRSRYTRPA